MTAGTATFTDKDKEAAFTALGDALFKSGKFNPEKAKPFTALSSNESFRVTRAAHRIAHRAVNDMASLPSLDWSALDEAIRLTATDENQVRDVACYLHSMRALAGTLKQEGLDRASAQDISGSNVALQLKNVLASVAQQYPSRPVEALMSAKVESLSSRTAARALYSALLSAGSLVPDAMQAEIGAATYFADDELPSEAYRDAEFSARLASELGEQRRDVYLVLSVDPIFLRHHGAAWFNLAPYFQLQKIGLIFIVAGGDDETTEVIDEARRFVATATAFHGGDADTFARAAVFVPCAVPEAVADRKTFFACARYLLLPDVLEATNRPALVVDVDMALRSDLSPFLAKLRDIDFACPFSKGLASLYPWRRYMANTVYFGNGSESRHIASDVSRYITRGLPMADTWTLDQNALSFAVERAIQRGQPVADANTLVRPLFQESIRSLFEKQSLSG